MITSRPFWMRRLALLAVAPLAVACSSDRRAEPVAEIPAPQAPADPISLTAEPAVAGATGASPSEAVATFLEARLTGDAVGALALVADVERVAFATVDDWVLRSESLPEVVDYSITGTSGATVTVSATLVPRLDASAGFRPGRAEMVWETVAEGGGYRVSLAATRLQPVLPDTAAAMGAARRWVASAMECATEGQYAGNLLGDPLVFDTLCGADVRFDDAIELPLSAFVDPVAIQASLGADAAVFTTVVRLGGTDPLDVVLAPLGDQWQVVGVAPPP